MNGRIWNEKNMYVGNYALNIFVGFNTLFRSLTSSKIFIFFVLTVSNSIY